MDAWIDEDQLVFGGKLLDDLKDAVSTKTDYLIVFIDENSSNSPWVKQEVDWALDAENARGHQLIIPVVIGDISISETIFEKLSERRLLVISDFSESAVRNLAADISDSVIKLLCDRVEKDEKVSQPVRRLEDLERILHDFSREFRQIVFPHRHNNPCTPNKILEALKERIDFSIESINDLDEIVDRSRRLNLISGIHYDYDEVYVVEEHYNWKATLYYEEKKSVAAAALKYIKPGMTIGIDAGSATGALVELIAKKLASRSLTDITIITNSLSSAGLLSEVCLSEGASNLNLPFDLVLSGGMVRPNTLALVGSEQHPRRELDQVFHALGVADISFIGVNGVSLNGELTTHSNIETQVKSSFIENSKRQYILADHSKIGVVADTVFGHIGLNTYLFVDDHASSQELISHLPTVSSNLIIAPVQGRD